MNLQEKMKPIKMSYIIASLVYTFVGSVAKFKKK